MLEFEKNIFEDAPDIVPVIFFIKKSKDIKDDIKTYKLIKGAKPNNISHSQMYIINNP